MVGSSETRTEGASAAASDGVATDPTDEAGAGPVDEVEPRPQPVRAPSATAAAVSAVAARCPGVANTSTLGM
jgi:hypothetical protein